MDTGISLRRVIQASKVPLILAILVASGLAGFRSSRMALILVVGGLGALLLLKQPALGLVALAGLSFTLPLTVGTGSEIPLTPPAFLIPALTSVWLVDSLRRRSLELPASRTTLPLLLFAGSGLVSLGFGTLYWDPAVPRADNLVLVQLAQWAIFALSAAVFLLAGMLGRDTRWLRFATWTFLGLAGVVVLEVYFPWLHRAVGWNSPAMAKSSMFLTWLAALSMGQLLFNRDLGPVVKGLLLALWAGAAYVVWFIWNEWTSGLLPFSVATATVVWLAVWRRSQKAALLMTLAGIGLTVVLYPVVFELSGGERELAYSWGGRMVLYQAVLDLVKKHPVLGLGPAAYRHYGYVHMLSEGAGGALYLQAWLSSHNNYIDIYAQMGLVGLGFFLWFLAELGAVGWRLTARFRGDFEDGYVHGALGGLVGSLAAMMLVDWFLPFVYNVGFPGFRTSALAWMFLGGLVALEQISDSTEARGDLVNG